MISHSIQTYESYRDSEFPWLDRYPVGWVLVQLKSCAAYQEGPGIMAEDFHEAGVPLIRISGMKGNTVTLDGCNYLDPGKVARRWNHFRLRAGELLVSASATTGIAARVDEQSAGAIAYTGLIRFRSRKITDTGFLQYFLVSQIFTDQIDYHKSGSTIQHYGPTHLGRVFALLPPLPEQKAIAEYLDRKTGAIDRKMELLEKKAQLYRDLKQSLINETVTRGLDKSVTLRDSGVDWIGRIPEHWTIDRIGTAFEERSQKVSSLKYPALSVTMSGIVPQLDTAAKSKHDDNRKRVAVGDFVINSRSDRRGSSGVSSLDGSVSVISIVLKPRKQFHGKYLHHLFRSYRFIEEFYRVGQGIVADLWTTRYSVMKAIEFAFPPMAEQEAIASYLDERAEKVDRIVETVETQIAKLKELRKALINDVVTGKTRVTQPTAAETI